MGITVITLILIWLLLWTKPQPQAKLQAHVPVKVILANVEEREIQPYEVITGRLQPIKTAKIRFEVAGRVGARLVEPGTSLSAGSVMLELLDEDYEDQLLQAESELVIEQKGATRDRNLLDYARTNLRLQQQEEARLQSLVEQNLIAQSKLDVTRQRVFDLQSEVARLEFSDSTAQARIRMKESLRDIAKRNLVRTKLRAPFDGWVNQVMVDEGDYVSINQAAISLVDTSKFDLQLDVRGEVITGLRLNQEIEVTANDRSIRGTVVAMQLDPDINTHTHQIRIRVANDALQSGMLANATIPFLVQDQATLIPVSSVLTQRGKAFVFVVQGNRITKTDVKLGRRVNNEYIVLDGLVPGQKIVARDVTSLSDEQVIAAE